MSSPCSFTFDQLGEKILARWAAAGQQDKTHTEDTDRKRLDMYLPTFFLVPLMALTLMGSVALAAKIVIYCLFQRSLGIRKAVLIAVGVHFLSLVTGLAGALLMAIHEQHPPEAVRGAHHRR